MTLTLTQIYKMLDCLIIAPNSALTKHWLEVIAQVSTGCQHTDSLERLLISLNEWKFNRRNGPRDSVGYPGANAEFVIEEKTLLVNKVSHDGKKKKLMATVVKLPDSKP